MPDTVNTWASPEDIAKVWRPLTDEEKTRAAGLLEAVERAINRRWPATAKRIADHEITKADVADVEVWAVLPLLGVDPREVPANAKSFQRTAGTESQSIVLAAPGTDTFLTFAPWMVDVLEPEAQQDDDWGLPTVEAPASRMEDVGWEWREDGLRRAP